MSPGPRRRHFAPPPPARLLAVVMGACVLGALTGPTGAAAQQGTQEMVSERQLEYRSAQSAHQAALDARSAAERRFDRVLDQIRSAEDANDQDRLKAAYAQAQDQALQLQSLEQRVRETADRTRDSRDSLVSALNVRVDSLMTALSAATSRSDQADLGAIIRDLTNQIRDLEDQSNLQEESRMVALPEIAWDPRDGVQELNWKAELLERRGRQYGQRLNEIDAQIKELRRRERRNRNLNDLLTGIQRFGDDQVPVVSPSESSDPQSPQVGQDDATSSDSTSAGSQSVTLDQRIARLNVLRSRIKEFRDEVVRRAQRFRQRAREISS